MFNSSSISSMETTIEVDARWAEFLCTYVTSYRTNFAMNNLWRRLCCCFNKMTRLFDFSSNLTNTKRNITLALEYLVCKEFVYRLKLNIKNKIYIRQQSLYSDCIANERQRIYVQCVWVPSVRSRNNTECKGTRVANIHLNRPILAKPIAISMPTSIKTDLLLLKPRYLEST